MSNPQIFLPLFSKNTKNTLPPTTPRALSFTTITKAQYKHYVNLWHSTLPTISDAWAHKICYGATYCNNLYAVAGWSKPVAIALPQTTWLELRRFAIGPNAPKYTASRMLAWMTHDLYQQFPKITNLISYQDTNTHTGTIYKAANWTPTHLSRGDTWARNNRSNRQTISTAPKQRWEKTLNTPT